jgi:hypothetical protein
MLAKSWATKRITKILASQIFDGATMWLEPNMPIVLNNSSIKIDYLRAMYTLFVPSTLEKSSRNWSLPVGYPVNTQTCLFRPCKRLKGKAIDRHRTCVFFVRRSRARVGSPFDASDIFAAQVGESLSGSTASCCCALIRAT